MGESKSEAIEFEIRQLRFWVQKNWEIKCIKRRKKVNECHAKAEERNTAGGNEEAAVSNPRTSLMSPIFMSSRILGRRAPKSCTNTLSRSDATAFSYALRANNRWTNPMILESGHQKDDKAWQRELRYKSWRVTLTWAQLETEFQSNNSKRVVLSWQPCGQQTGSMLIGDLIPIMHWHFRWKKNESESECEEGENETRRTRRRTSCSRWWCGALCRGARRWCAATRSPSSHPTPAAAPTPPPTQTASVTPPERWRWDKNKKGYTKKDNNKKDNKNETKWILSRLY